MNGFQSFDKLNLSQRRLERSALSARSLPRSSALESHGVKKLAESLEFFTTGNMADCGDAFVSFDPITQHLLQFIILSARGLKDLPAVCIL